MDPFPVANVLPLCILCPVLHGLSNDVHSHITCMFRLFVFVLVVCKYFESPGGVGSAGLFGEEARGLCPLVEQMLGGQALSLRDVSDLKKGKK